MSIALLEKHVLPLERWFARTLPEENLTQMNTIFISENVVGHKTVAWQLRKFLPSKVWAVAKKAVFGTFKQQIESPKVAA